MAYMSDKGINDTRAAMRKQNARIKADLNEQAHDARMTEFEALLDEYTTATIRAVDSLRNPGTDLAAGVKHTEARAKLRGYVQTMSRRIKVR